MLLLALLSCSLPEDMEPFDWPTSESYVSCDKVTCYNAYLMEFEADNDTLFCFWDCVYDNEESESVYIYFNKGSDGCYKEMSRWYGEDYCWDY